MLRRISPDHPVRRCLFPATEDDEGRIDNHVNGTVEVMDRELEEKKRKWNYDFENDVPMKDKGNVKWKYQNENGDWIGEIQNDDEPDKMENKTVESEPRDDEAKVEDVRMQNEETPHPSPVKEVAPPPVRKRSREDSSPTDTGAKRKL